jgi:addiction module RelB/DinJ family antitoxin
MSEVINFRIDKKTKNEAQNIAQKMGLNLSDVLKVFLKGFVRDKRLEIDLEEPSDWFVEQMAEAKADIKAGRVSPMFDNAEDAIKWLDNKNRKYANRV